MGRAQVLHGEAECQRCQHGDPSSRPIPASHPPEMVGEEVGPQKASQPEEGRDDAAALGPIATEELVDQGNAPVIEGWLLEEGRVVQGGNDPGPLGDLLGDGCHAWLIRSPQVMSQNAQ